MRPALARTLALAAALTVPAAALGATAPSQAAAPEPHRAAAQRDRHRGRCRHGCVHRQRGAVGTQPAGPRGHRRRGRLQRRPAARRRRHLRDGDARHRLRGVRQPHPGLPARSAGGQVQDRPQGRPVGGGTRGDRRPLRQHRAHRRRQRHRPGDRERRHRLGHEATAAAPAEPDHARARLGVLRLPGEHAPRPAGDAGVDRERGRLHQRAAAGAPGRVPTARPPRAATTRRSARGPSPSPRALAPPRSRSPSAATRCTRAARRSTSGSTTPRRSPSRTTTSTWSWPTTTEPGPMEASGRPGGSMPI